LEALEDQYTTIILKGFTRITTVDVRGVRLDAVEMREMGSNAPVKGVVIVLRDTGGQLEDNRAFIDYDELDPLMNAIDTLSRVDENTTKLASFEGHYRTKGVRDTSIPADPQRQCNHITNWSLRSCYSNIISG
jgi:hypothetical protein